MPLRLLILPLALLGLSSCTTPAKPTPETPTKFTSSVLAKKIDKYAWRLQLTVKSAAPKSQRTVWFTVPHSGITAIPLEDCTHVSAQASYSNGSWTQPGGPRWFGYLIFEPDASPPQLELRCVERSDCACRHLERSELSGIHPVSKWGRWRQPPP